MMGILKYEAGGFFINFVAYLSECLQLTSQSRPAGKLIRLGSA